MMKHKVKQEEKDEQKEPVQSGPNDVQQDAAAIEEPASDKTDNLEEELAAMNDKYLRLYSEYDNYRKRTQRERAELLKTASSDVITSLLPVLDDFERALKSVPEGDPAYMALRDGVTLIYNKLSGTLNQLGLEPMKTMGVAFDTDFHEAVTNIPAPTPEAKGTILDEIQKGYMLNGKVIRFAKVVVGG